MSDRSPDPTGSPGPVRRTRENDARVRFATLSLVQALWQANHDGPPEEVAEHIMGAKRTLHPYAIEQANLGEVERAFGDLRGWQDVSSLAALARRNRPLLLFRCKADKAQPLAAVWAGTRVGALLVTGHLFVTRLDGDDGRPARLKTAGLDSEMWAPRLGAMDQIRGAEDAVDLLPLVCARCRRTSPMTWTDLTTHVNAARATRRGQVFV